MNQLVSALNRINAETIEQYQQAENPFEFCCKFLEIESYAPYAEAWVQSMQDRIEEQLTNSE